MDEYIKREDALDAVLFALVGTGYQSRAIYAIRDIATADVVPKSEVEVWKQNRFNLYQKLECYEMARQKVAREFAKYLIDHSQDGAVMISDLPDLVVDFTKGADNGDKQ
jgi:hypothetical protein